MNSTELEELVGSSIDHKNIELAIILFSLRHDLDIHCLIALNASKIDESGQGRFFFGHIQMRIIASIALEICKIYEDEKKKYELNSIGGVINSLINKKAEAMDQSKIKQFVQKYNGPTEPMRPTDMLHGTLYGFRESHKAELSRFKDVRDKVVAHSEFGVNLDSMPSFDTMERLFSFGADFYVAISETFLEIVPDDLRKRREVKQNFKKLLESLGIRDIRTEME